MPVLHKNQRAEVFVAAESVRKDLWYTMIDTLSDPLVPLFTPKVVDVSVKKDKGDVVDSKKVVLKKEVKATTVKNSQNNTASYAAPIVQNYYYLIRL